jgi:DNA-binding transcriptional regulator YiaG
MKKPKAPNPDQIKAAREKSGLTQTDAAALIGYTKRAWQDWEAGKRGMRRLLFDLFVERSAQRAEIHETT